MWKKFLGKIVALLHPLPLKKKHFYLNRTFTTSTFLLVLDLKRCFWSWCRMVLSILPLRVQDMPKCCSCLSSGSCMRCVCAKSAKKCQGCTPCYRNACLNPVNRSPSTPSTDSVISGPPLLSTYMIPLSRHVSSLIWNATDESLSELMDSRCCKM